MFSYTHKSRSSSRIFQILPALENNPDIHWSSHRLFFQSFPSFSNAADLYGLIYLFLFPQFWVWWISIFYEIIMIIYLVIDDRRFIFELFIFSKAFLKVSHKNTCEWFGKTVDFLEMGGVHRRAPRAGARDQPGAEEHRRHQKQAGPAQFWIVTLGLPRIGHTQSEESVR